MALDQIQYKAVRHFNGPAMILAGPGSGKTTVITHRVFSLINDRKVPDDEILVITFTKMAAVEMKERYLKMANLRFTPVDFGTFHAVFFMILRDACGFKATDIVKVKDQWDFVRTQFSMYGVDVRDENGVISDIISEIARVKSLPDEKIQEYCPISCERRLFVSIFREYEQWLETSHMVDFEDMMKKTYCLLRNTPDILNKWQNRYRYVLIDEFQDASPIQFEIVKMLVMPHQNIFIVGDDDQSIYGFRGAAPGVMQEFKKSFPDCAVYTLNINYRSTGSVVKAATRLINNNSDRFYKDLKAYNDMGEDVVKLLFESTEEEVKYISDLVSDKKPTAVLTRTNSGAAELRRYLLKHGISFRKSECKNDGENIFLHWIAQDITAYFNLARGERARRDLLRIINKPSRYISRQYFMEKDVDFDLVLLRMKQGNQDRLIKNMNSLMNDLRCISSMPPYAAINYIRKKVGYDAYIYSYCRKEEINSELFMSILDRLQDSSRNFSTLEQWINMVSDGTISDDTRYPLKYSEKSLPDNCTSDSVSNVNICTMHSSKGLEYERVIIIDANEGITPYNKAVSKEEIEEERRLFYVAMTRAKKNLIICSVKRRNNKMLLPSRFVKEI